jgi:hypothetical protein
LPVRQQLNSRLKTLFKTKCSGTKRHKTKNIMSNQESSRQSNLPTTTADWERALRSIRETYLAARHNQPPTEFFSTGKRLYDGHLLLVGKDAQPLYLVILALGPLVAESLGAFFIGHGNDFVEINCWGNSSSDRPWAAAGAFPAARALPKREQGMMVLMIGSLIQELTEQFTEQQKKN